MRHVTWSADVIRREDEREKGLIGALVRCRLRHRASIDLITTLAMTSPHFGVGQVAETIKRKLVHGGAATCHLHAVALTCEAQTLPFEAAAEPFWSTTRCLCLVAVVRAARELLGLYECTNRTAGGVSLARIHDNAGRSLLSRADTERTQWLLSLDWTFAYPGDANVLPSGALVQGLRFA